MAANLTTSDWKGFKSCKSSVADETDDDRLWIDGEEHGNVITEFEEDEGTGCEDGESDTDW